MSYFIKIISLPFKIALFFFREFYSIYYDVFTDSHHFFQFLRIQIFILFGTSLIGVFAISLGNLKKIFIVYILGLGIVVGIFAYFFLTLFADKGVDVLWGLAREPTTEELARPYFDKAELALREERYETAILLLERVLELDPKQLKALMKIAKIYHHQKEGYQKALNIYKKILNIIGWEEQDSYYYIEAKKGINEIIKMFNRDK
jgi:tetratricopeptide (TPR) repeat protein